MARSMFAVEGVKFRPIPILLTIVLGLGLPYVAAYLVVFAGHVIPLPSPRGALLPWLYAQHGAQFLVALVAIAIIKHFVPGDYGLHLPRGKTYIGAAILWGVFFGILMLAVDFWPNFFSGHAPALGYEMTPGNVAGWLGFEAVYVGPTEETLFRGLLVTYLALTMPGRIRFLRYEMNIAGVLVAVIFALAHFTSFFTDSIWVALGQQLYAIALGILYAYWLEKSKSLVAPVIGHNVSDAVETALQMLWVCWAG